MGDVVNISVGHRRPRKPRPRKFVWIDTLKADPRLRTYPHVSPRLLTDYAELLSTFSSFSNEGVYAGRANFRRRLGVSIRQVTRLVNALADMGYIRIERRGPRTNLVIPYLDGVRLFPIGAEVTSKGTEEVTSGHIKEGTSGHIKGHSRGDQKVPSNDEKRGPPGHPSLLSLDSDTKLSSPLIPPSAAQRYGIGSPSGKTASGLPTGAEGQSTDADIAHGEVVLQPNTEITFSDFWNETRRGASGKDPAGPARAEWQKLSREDRAAVADLLEREGIDLVETYTCTWLKQRAWEEEPLIRGGMRGCLDAIDRRFGFDLDAPIAPASPPPLPKPIERQPHVLDRIWAKLGSGDLDRGCEIWQRLDQPQRDELKELERAASLDEDVAVKIAGQAK